MASKRTAREHFVSLRNLRIASGKRQSDVCEFVTEYLNLATPFTPGSLSLIENGKRGASQKVLDALAASYGLEPGAIRSDYTPQDRKVRAA